MPVHQENDIIIRIQNGAVNEFEYLVEAYQNAVFRIVGNLIDAPHQLEDLVQDVFLAAFTHIGSFDPDRGKFKTWLFAIARNRALNARRKKRETQLPDDCILPDHKTPMDDLMVKEAFEHLDCALAGLTFQDRVIFILAELEGLSYGEIARIEKLRLGTVKSRLSRIRQKIRRCVPPEQQQPCRQTPSLGN